MKVNSCYVAIHVSSVKTERSPNLSHTQSRLLICGTFINHSHDLLLFAGDKLKVLTFYFAAISTSGVCIKVELLKNFWDAILLIQNRKQILCARHFFAQRLKVGHPVQHHYPHITPFPPKKPLAHTPISAIIAS